MPQAYRGSRAAKLGQTRPASGQRRGAAIDLSKSAGNGVRKLLKHQRAQLCWTFGGLRKLLEHECAQRRGYRGWGDLARMCADEALFQEVVNSDWNKKADNNCSCAINNYRRSYGLPHFTRRSFASAPSQSVRA